MSIQIGVVGYSTSDFNESTAESHIRDGFDRIDQEYSETIVIVSGLTNLGIPKLAYEEAVQRGWKTVGVACSKANEVDCFPVDEKEIVGDEWGDESKQFLDRIDVLLRIGGGDQALEETEKARSKGITVYEYEI